MIRGGTPSWDFLRARQAEVSVDIHDPAFGAALRAQAADLREGVMLHWFRPSQRHLLLCWSPAGQPAP